MERTFSSLFANPWATKLKAFFGKVRESVRSYWSRNLVVESFLQKCLEGILGSKINLLSVGKYHFSIFCKSLCGKVGTICCKSQEMCPKLFKFKIVYRKLLRKWFWSYFELKSEYSECLKRPFFSFLETFEWQKWDHFLEQWDKAFKNSLNQSLVL